MEYVNPIKDLKKISDLKKIIKNKSSRDYLLFIMGINTGLRIGELLSLKIGSVIDENRNLHTFLFIREQAVYLNENVRKAVKHFFQVELPPLDHYLFRSSRGDQPITRQQAYRILNQAAAEAGIDEKVGTHTLRKTFGYHAFIKGIAISLIQERFHQATPGETFRYIGIEKTEKQKLDVNL